MVKNLLHYTIFVKYMDIKRKMCVLCGFHCILFIICWLSVHPSICLSVCIYIYFKFLCLFAMNLIFFKFVCSSVSVFICYFYEHYAYFSIKQFVSFVSVRNDKSAWDRNLTNIYLHKSNSSITFIYFLQNLIFLVNLY